MGRHGLLGNFFPKRKVREERNTHMLNTPGEGSTLSTQRSGQLWDALPAFWLSNRRAHRLSTWSPAGLQNAADAGTLGPRAHALELEQVHSSPHTVVSLRGRSALWCWTEGFRLHVWLIPYLCGFCPSLLGMNFFFVACWQWMLGINFNYPLLWHMYVNYIFPWTLC